MLGAGLLDEPRARLGGVLAGHVHEHDAPAATGGVSLVADREPVHDRVGIGAGPVAGVHGPVALYLYSCAPFLFGAGRASRSVQGKTLGWWMRIGVQNHRLLSEKCCRSITSDQRPPQCQPASRKALTGAEPSVSMPGRGRERSRYGREPGWLVVPSVT